MIPAIAVFAMLVAEEAAGQSETLFAGVPSVRISEGGLERTVENLKRPEASNFAVVISEINGKFYWASRENKELIATPGVAFITFSAVDGSGYIRFLLPESKRAAALAWPNAEAFDYVEHLLIGLSSVTYYGVLRQ